MKRKLLAGLLVATVALALVLPSAVLAADPTVSITVTAQTVSVTNTQDTWAMSIIVPDAVLYFSADNAQDDDYSQLENTGNVACDVEIQGVNIEGGDYDWTLATAASSETYSLFANDAGTPTVYDIEVKSSSYTDLKGNLAVSANVTWSMKFTAPTGFNAADDGVEKTATITLVASKYVA